GLGAGAEFSWGQKSHAWRRFAPLTRARLRPLVPPSAGRTAAAARTGFAAIGARWRKVRAPGIGGGGERAPGGAPRERAQKKDRRAGGAPLKGRGESGGKKAPRLRQRRADGEHPPEPSPIAEGRLGRLGAFGCQAGPGSIPATARVGCSRRCASGVPDEWPSRRGDPPDRTRLIGRLTPLAPRLILPRRTRSGLAASDALRSMTSSVRGHAAVDHALAARDPGGLVGRQIEATR